MMTDAEQERRRALKRRFILAGVAAGALFSLTYIALNMAGRSITGAPTAPDPVSTRFVNAFLIFGACVLQASIFGRLAGWLTKRM